MSNSKEETSTSKSKSTPSSGSSAPDSIDLIRQLLAEKLKIAPTKPQDEKKKRRQILETVDFAGIIKHWNVGGFKKIITMVGAGISTSAGIPDFRSPTTGLYSNLKKYKLPYPSAIFEVDYFRSRPKPFFALAKELYPGSFRPTPCHHFIKLLNDKGLLLRHYTQNIDTLERIAGIPDEKLVEAHGTFHTNHCIDCRRFYPMDWMKEQIFNDHIPTCEHCNGLVKPDIVFFGENLPDKFYTHSAKDFRECDLLIIMGTSLEVQPFASLINDVNDKCVRLLINRESVGSSMKNSLRSYLFDDGLHFDAPDNERDVCWLGNCDDGIIKLAEELGFIDELNELIDLNAAEKKPDCDETTADVGSSAKIAVNSNVDD